MRTSYTHPEVGDVSLGRANEEHLLHFNILPVLLKIRMRDNDF